MILLMFVCATLWVVWTIAAFFLYRPRPITGATVVITGACSEMGRRLCMQLYARGARVIAWDYSKIKLQELQADILKAAEAADHPGTPTGADARTTTGPPQSDDFVVVAVDVSSRLQVQRAVKELEGPVDIIVNAAHMRPSKRLGDRGDDSAERVVQTNLLSPLVVVRQLLPQLLTASGTASGHRRRDDYAQVVNLVSADAGYTLTPDIPEYAASQWGMVGLHYSMREWIAQKRSEYAADAASARKTSSTRTPPAAREVRMTLVCVNEVQYGMPTVMSSLLSNTSSGLESAARATTSPATPLVPTRSPERDSGSGSGSRGRAAPTNRDTYLQALQRRNAELDRAAAGCVSAICRGQERYCHTSSWATSVFYPLAMACPVPWATRILRWMQRSTSSTAAAVEG
ncbi:short-chain dehydrogenase [Novymonas esmeraldas]|uniref:Short-chain dehydrogenase n=1 Tax=Novymonas esmeraldas TaxID=1808958 RepID=A0AAW0F1D8_9TRYP